MVGEEGVALGLIWWIDKKGMLSLLLMFSPFSFP
jgi:hypothetical protein